MTESADSDKRPYRLGVGIVLISRDGLVFAGERHDTPGAWQLPQGGIDEREDPLAAAVRELAEETGTDKAELLAESRDWLRYDLPEALARTAWQGRYRGQKQKWFAFRFLGEDRDFDLAADQHPEFARWRWLRLADLPATIVDFKRPLYEKLAAEFRHLVAEA